MMFVSIGIGSVLAVALIVVVSILTGAKVTNNNGLPTSNLVGQKVSSFTLTGLNGDKVTAPWATHHAGVLIFFASYCGPCHAEMPKVATYVRTHHQGSIVVMGVDADDARASAQAFVRRSKVTFPIAFDPNGVVTTNLFKFQTVPETVFVSRRGVVEQVYFGAIPVDQLKSGLAALAKT